MSIKEVELPIIGMHCAGCVANIERVLSRKVDGVVDCSVNLATETASVRYDPELTDLKTIAEVVDSVGYRAVLPAEESEGADEEQTARERELTDQRRRLLEGDVVIVRPGERIPDDGEVISGRSDYPGPPCEQYGKTCSGPFSTMWLWYRWLRECCTISTGFHCLSGTCTLRWRLQPWRPQV